MGRGNRKKNRRDVEKRRLDTVASDACGDAYHSNRAQKSKKRRCNGEVPHSLTTTELKLDISSQNKARDDQKKCSQIGTYWSANETTNTKIGSMIETGCTREGDIEDYTCPDDKTKPDYAAVLKKGLKDRANFIQTKFPDRMTADNKQGFVVVYTATCRSASFPSLKCTSDDSDICNDMTPKIFFQQEELTVTATLMKDSYANDGLQVCRAFDNSFVKKHTKSFIPYWKNILKYVTDNKHIIDLHGLTLDVALAASEYAVSRERQYAKDVKGNGCGKYKKLEIITGRGNHSKGPPVLHGAVQNHLKTLGHEKVKQSASNQGLLEVDVRNAKSTDMTYCAMYDRRSN